MQKSIPMLQKWFVGFLTIWLSVACTSQSTQTCGKSTDACTASGVLSLSASASVEVPQDTVQITLFSEVQGSNPGDIARQLNQKTSQALSQTKVQQTIQVRTGRFSVYPVNDKSGHISGWRGRTELLLQATDFEAAARLASQLGDLMQISEVHYSLSDAMQRQVETELLQQAISAFKQKADVSRRAFGYRHYKIREIQIEGRTPKLQPYINVMAAMSVSDFKNRSEVSLSGGVSTVSLTISGNVQLQ